MKEQNPKMHVVYKIGWIRWYKGFANFDKKIKELYRKNLDINKKL